MIAARDDERALSDDELVANCVLILLAGHETTTNLIGNGALALLRHPDQLALLRREPALATNVVEECLRYDPPVQLTSREPLEDVAYRDFRFEKGVELNLMFGSANRDEEVFEGGDRFDVRRANASSHLSFGHGAHFCLGSTLARLEGEVAFRALATRMSRIELDGEPPRRAGLVIRGLSALPVRF